MYTVSLQMLSNVISFRFSDAELKALKKFKIPEDKSSNQIAARLLRGMFTGIIEPPTVLSTDVDIESIVKREVENAIARSALPEAIAQSALPEVIGNSERLQEMIAANTAYLETSINEIKTEIDLRLGELNA